MFQKSLRKVCSIHKQELLTTRVLKCGVISPTMWRVTSGLSAVSYTSQSLYDHRSELMIWQASTRKFCVECIRKFPIIFQRTLPKLSSHSYRSKPKWGLLVIRSSRYQQWLGWERSCSRTSSTKIFIPKTTNFLARFEFPKIYYTLLTGFRNLITIQLKGVTSTIEARMLKIHPRPEELNKISSRQIFPISRSLSIIVTSINTIQWTQPKEELLRVRTYLILGIGLEAENQTQNKSKRGLELRMIRINKRNWRDQKIQSKKTIQSVQER